MTKEIKKVGIIGAGQMGMGISHVCAISGLPIVLVDVSDDILSKAYATIERNLKRQAGRGLISDKDRDAALGLIATSTDFSALKDCDLVIEAATEDEDVKSQIYEKVCAVLPEDTFLTTNTSSISITRLAAKTDRPEKFMGLHFMNPAPLMELVELIRGIATDAETFDSVKDFVTKLGKASVSSEVTNAATSPVNSRSLGT